MLTTYKWANVALLRCEPPTASCVLSGKAVTRTVALTIPKAALLLGKLFELFFYLCCATAGVFFNTNAALGAIIIYHCAKKARKEKTLRRTETKERKSERKHCMWFPLTALWLWRVKRGDGGEPRMCEYVCVCGPVFNPAARTSSTESELMGHCR